MLAEYFPILVFLGISITMGIALVVIGGILGPNRPDSEKLSPYECGFEAFEDSRMQFDVRYYLVAILFIIFDLEIAFFIPWAVVLDSLGIRLQMADIVRIDFFFNHQDYLAVSHDRGTLLFENPA